MHTELINQRQTSGPDPCKNIKTLRLRKENFKLKKAETNYNNLLIRMEGLHKDLEITRRLTSNVDFLNNF